MGKNGKEMIDLSRFNKKEIATVPVISGSTQFRKRKIFFRLESKYKPIDGWYRVELSDCIGFPKNADEIDIKKALGKLPSIQGYSFGDEVVPLHFDSAGFKYGLSESIPVHFMKAPLWSISKIRRWESGDWLFDSLDAKADICPLLEVRKRFEKDQDIKDLKGITPELRYYFIIMRFQKNGLRQIADLEKLKLTKQEREKRLKDFQNTLSGRLEKTIADAGGHLDMFKRRGEDLIVDWSVGGQKFNSLIRADSLKIRELGYCASGEDRRHSMTSAVLLAQEYQKDGSIYITRE